MVRHVPLFILGTLVAWSVLNGCSSSDSDSAPLDPPLARAPPFAVTLAVTDENGEGVSVAVVTVHAGDEGVTLTPSGDADGRFRVTNLQQPTLIVVDAPGFLPEPVAVGRGDSAGEVPVRLLRAAGPEGQRRIAMHFAGDFMLGRRYVEPTGNDTAVVTPGDGGSSARAVVEAVVPLFAAAHLKSFNLETVVGNLPESAAYSKKRYILQSPPESLEALRFLRVNVVNLGNNHVRDWLEDGLQATLDSLDAAGLSHVGASTSANSANDPLIFEFAGYRVGFLSYTSVHGDFVNDSLPEAGDPRPEELPEEKAWQYEERTFGFLGPSVAIESKPRRIGEAWRIFDSLEEDIPTDQEVADLWAALAAVYPELQDWVARRGHGGASLLSTAQVTSDVVAVRDQGVELVVVQLHSGYQFAEVKSRFTELAAHTAIDAGADLVICHHPHVLQGFEYYKGKLVAHSLGNLVFDQDFLATFASAVVRAVFQDTELIEVRVYPTMLDLYRPVPVVGEAARDIVLALHERSVLPANSRRVAGEVRMALQEPGAEVEIPRFVFERNTARIDRVTPLREPLAVTLHHDGIFQFNTPGLTRSRGPGGVNLSDVLLGRDLFRWGSFEDLAADKRARGGHHWVTNDSYKRIEVLEGEASGIRALRIRRDSTNTSRALVRPVARVTFQANRLFEEQEDGSMVPVDGQPSYSLAFLARLDGGGSPLVRFDVYDFDDSDPTTDAESRLVRSRRLTLPLEPDDEWHEVLFDLPAEVLAADAENEPNSVMFYLGMDPPASGNSVLLVDDLQFIEWREADRLPDGFYAVDAARAQNPATVAIRTLERIEE